MTNELEQLLVFIEQHGGSLLHHKIYGELMHKVMERENELLLENETLQNELSSYEWISSKESEPDRAGWYPAWSKGCPSSHQDWLNGDCWWNEGWQENDGYEVLYWRLPLPEPPEECR